MTPEDPSRRAEPPSLPGGAAAPPAVPASITLAVAVLATTVFGFASTAHLRNSGGISAFVFGSLTFGVHLAVAVMLARARTADPAPRYLLAILPVLGFVQGGPSLQALGLGPWPDLFGLGTLAVAVAIQPGLILAFLTVFPSRVKAAGTLTLLSVGLLSVAPAAYALWVLATRGPMDLARSEGFFAFVNLAVLLSNLAAIVRLFLAAFRPRGEEHVKARLVALPTAAWVVVLVIVDNLELDERWHVEQYFALLSIVFPVSLAFAVSRRRLFEVDRLVRKGTAYAAASIALLVALLLAAPAATALATSLVPGLSRPGETVTAFLAAAALLVLQPLRAAAQRGLDRLFYRDARDPSTLVTSYLGDSPPAAHPEAEVEGLIARVETSLRPLAQRLWLLPWDEVPGAASPAPRAAETSPAAPPPAPPAGTRNRGTDDTPTQALSALETAPPPTASTGPLPAVGSGATGLSRLALPAVSVRRVLAVLRGSRVASPERLDATERAIADELRRSGVTLLVPILATDGEPLGLWALAEKRSEEPWNVKETDALQALARGLALKLEGRRLAERASREADSRRRLAAHLSGREGSFLSECLRCGLCGDEEGPCPECRGRLVFTQAVPRRLLGRYVFTKRLGKGGMGVVYEARDETLSRSVAIKLLDEDQLRTSQAHERFVREARLSARLQHPNTVAVYDAGETDTGRAFFVMERLSGQDLGAVVRRGPLPADAAIEILDQVLAGLGAAHALGLVHRDVKPGNVFLAESQDGGLHVKLMDLGLGRSVHDGEDAQTPLTAAGSVLGTIGYIAPEVALGEPATPASDLWSAGVVLYELLAGRRPYPATTLVESYRDAAAERHTPLSQAAPGVSPALAAVVRRALAAEPSSRFETAAEMRRALAAAR
ncbi:MAG: serine/threonine protein kinase [Acidobacteria bacterium]|nr:serine/threonine protein kinase [Acidobacteriota bacterium]